MTFINWSDSEEMLGLLFEYVSDEKSDPLNDHARMMFLAGLSADLSGLAGASGMPIEEAIRRLREIHESRVEEFAGDPVLIHVESCIEELERIKSHLALATAVTRRG